jgi:hypothetical protein
MQTSKGTDMQAIVVKYVAPTNKRGARLRATSAAGSITVPYADQTSETANDRIMRAANALRVKLHWVGPHWENPIIGGLPNGDDVVVYSS